MGVGMNQMMALTGAVAGAATAGANIKSKLAKDDDGIMAKKARETVEAKIKTRKENIKASRVKMGGKK